MVVMKKLYLIVVLVCVAIADLPAQDIYTLISQGRLDKAGDSLAGLSSSSLRDGNILYYAGLIETDADKAAGLLEAALGSSVSAIHREEIQYLLAQYFFMKEDFPRARVIVDEYLSVNETGRHHGDVLRLAAVIDELSQDDESAARRVKRYLRLHSREYERQWGEIDEARLQWRTGEHSAARSGLRQLSREKSGEGIPAALYQLALDALNRNRVEDALRYYNLMREGYPASVGLDAVQEKLVNLPETDASELAAEELTHTYYSVKVGVFSVAKNARNRAADFTKYGHPVDVLPRKLSQKDYHVVLVGRFASHDEANTFKRQVEEVYGETFQVVAR